MSFMLAASGLLIPKRTFPYIQGLTTAIGTNVAPPSNRSGDLLVAGASHNGSGTPPTLPGPWVLWEALGSGSSMAFYYQRVGATPVTGTQTWTGVAGLRFIYNFRAAELGDVEILGTADSLTMPFPGITVARPSIIVGFGLSRNAQTNIGTGITAPPLPDGVQTRIANNGTTTNGQVLWDTGAAVNPGVPTLHTSFAGATMTLDTTSNGVRAGSFSIMGRLV